MAFRISATRLVAPVEVSLWTIATALMAWALSSASFASTTAGSAPRRQSVGTKSTESPKRSATSFHRTAKWPVSNISTLSPGDKVFTSDASQAPGPRRRVDHRRPFGLEDLLQAFENLPPEPPELRPAVIHGRKADRPQNPVRDVRRSRDLEKMAAASCAHSSPSQ